MRAQEERCGVSEAAVTRAARVQEDVEILQSALRDIARAVIQDAESRDTDTEKQAPPPHIHLSSSGPIPQRSPKRRSARSNAVPAFAESTISAVQAALRNYQLTIHELQVSVAHFLQLFYYLLLLEKLHSLRLKVKLQMNKEQVSATRKQCDDAETNAEIVAAKVAELVSQLDACRSQCARLNQEKESLQRSLDAVKLEKSVSDKSRMELDSTVGEKEREREILFRIPHAEFCLL